MKGFVKEYLLENWSLKATAFLLALILWLFVRGEPSQERGLAVPLEVLVPRNMEIANERPTSAEITYRGPAFSNIGSASCVIDLRAAKEGKQTITLTPDNVRMPKGLGIEILQVNPARVALVLEQTVSKELPIVVPIRGEPAQGFEVYGKISKPASIIASGPRSHIDPIKEASTDPVSVGGLKQSTRVFANLNLGDNVIRTSLMTPVQVDVQIGPRRRVYTIEHVPVTIDDDAYVTQPKQISIQVYAPPDSDGSISAGDFTALISSKSLDPSKIPAKVRPAIRISNALTSSVTIKEIQPPEVLVQSKK